jgi:hypothetical protein
MAIAAFKVRIFDSHNDLKDFVTTDGTVNTVISIVTDNNGKYVLFYV